MKKIVVLLGVSGALALALVACGSSGGNGGGSGSSSGNSSGSGGSGSTSTSGSGSTSASGSATTGTATSGNNFGEIGDSGINIFADGALQGILDAAVPCTSAAQCSSGSVCCITAGGGGGGLMLTGCVPSSMGCPSVLGTMTQLCSSQTECLTSGDVCQEFMLGGFAIPGFGMTCQPAPATATDSGTNTTPPSDAGTAAQDAPTGG